LTSDANGIASWKPPAGIPSGGIIMYSGPWNFDATGLGIGALEGWALCNGNNGTPDLSDRFVMGTTISGELGTTGGSKTHSHGPGEHNEVLFGPNKGSIQYIDDDGGLRVSAKDDGSYIYVANPKATRAQEFDHSGSPPNQSQNYLQLDPDFQTTSESHLPPYIKLAYIMKL